MFSFYIARRYLLTKRSHHAINIISGIAIAGVAVATAALVCILSVFNGFQDMVSDLFTAFDPELKVVPAEGKFMKADSPELRELKKNPDIISYSEALEDNALLTANNRQVMATIKGVDDNFEEMIDFDRIKYGEGVYELHADVLEYGILGINLLGSLGLGTDFSTPIQVYAPRGGELIDLNDPSESFNMDELYSPHVGFSVKQTKYDAHYVIASLRFTRKLFERDGMVSSVELQTRNGSDIDRVQKSIQKQLGDRYKVLNRYEQQEDTFKIMQIEKLMSYIFLVLILVIACFNIIGSLSMLIIEKKSDAVTLRSLGASDKQIADIFMVEGRLIALLGALLGIAVGIILCYIQQEYGVIRFGHSAGSYIIDAYPVNIHIMDIIIIFITVVLIGFLSVWYPVRHLSKKFTTTLTAVAVISIGLVSCGPNGQRFQIDGEFTDMPAGQLFFYNPSDNNARFDTVKIADGKFRYKGSIDKPTPCLIVFPNALEQVIFVSPGSTLSYRASANDLKNYTVEGSEENTLMNQFRQETNGLDDMETRDKAMAYIQKYAQSPVAMYLFERYLVQDATVPVNGQKDLLRLLKQTRKDDTKLLALEQKVKSMELFQNGKTLPSITMKTKNGKKINIGKQDSDFTLLVFWAAWMERQYEYIDVFHRLCEDFAKNSSHLKVITISLDHQQYSWEDFIRYDTLYASHIYDGLSWESPAVRKLGIQTVPSYILADSKHKIIAHGKSAEDMRKDVEKYVDAQ